MSEFLSSGSPNPSICFCLTNPTKEILDFIRDFQNVSPIFIDSDGNKHRLTCETIIRIEDKEKIKPYVFGIDDLYVSENMREPFLNRSIFEVYYKHDDNPNHIIFVPSPEELSKAIKDVALEKEDSPKVGCFLITLNSTKMTSRN